MPPWMTSLFRLEVSVPWRSRRSSRTRSGCDGASRAATARPTTPAPTTVTGVSAMADDASITLMPEDVRHDWTTAQVESLYALPLTELLFRAQSLHRRYHDPAEVQRCTLLSVKTGGCPEDCGYCPQSARYETGVGRQELMRREDVLSAARTARANGSTRFCMGAAWR